MATNAVTFNGSSQYGEIPETTTLAGLTSFTMEGWVKNTSTSMAYSPILEIGNSNVNPGIATFKTENGVGNTGINWGVAYDGANNSDGFTSTAYITQDAWVHFALVHDGATKITRVYVGGVEISYNLQQTGAGSLRAFANTFLWFGRNMENGFTSEYFDGSMGGFIRVWNTTRTLAQIRNNVGFNLEKSQETGLIVNLKFLEGSGTTIANDAVAGDVCTLVGSPSWTTGPTIEPRDYSNRLNAFRVNFNGGRNGRPRPFGPGIAR